MLLGADATSGEGILKPPHRTKFLANQKTVKTKLHQTLLRGTQVAKHYLSNDKRSEPGCHGPPTSKRLEQEPKM